MTSRPLLIVLALSFGLFPCKYSLGRNDWFKTKKCAAIAARLVNLVLQPINLEDAVKHSGLPKKVIATMKEHSRGVLDIYAYLKLYRDRPHRPAVMLGVSYRYEKPLNLLMQSYARITKVEYYADTYKRMRLGGIDMENPETDKLMSNLMDENKTIVFLIPNDFPVNRGATWEEFQWLMRQPSNRLKNVYFVFGAYDTLTKDEVWQISSELNSTQEKLINRLDPIFYRFEYFMAKPAP